MRRMLSAIVGALLLLLVQQACLVDSRCVNDRDCPYPQRCGTDGACRLECSASAPDTCLAARPHCLVVEQRCVECLESRDCSGDARCVSHNCVPEMAPLFALLDQNPASDSFEEEVALATLRGRVVLIYFAGLG